MPERTPALALYVDRVRQQWIVLDRDGNYWTLSSDDENPWDLRQPYQPTEETELEPVPGHYKFMLGIPA